MMIDIAKMVDSALPPFAVFVGGMIAKFLRDISVELHGIKTAIAVTTNRVDAHDMALTIHDERIRALETQ